MCEQRFQRKIAIPDSCHREFNALAINGRIAFMCVNDVQAMPIPLLHVYLPQPVLMVASDHESSSHAGNRCRQIERLLRPNAFDHPRAKLAVSKLVDLLDRGLSVSPLQ